MKQDRIRVAIMDHHGVFAGALSRRLCAEPDLQVVGTAGALAQALDLLMHNEIDVVTLNLDFAGRDGLTVGHRLFARCPGLGIVVITAAVDDDRFSEALAMGVRGWVPIQAAIETLLAAIRAAARGETLLPAELLTRVLAPEPEPEPAKSPAPRAKAIALLTDHELDVLRCLMDGLSRREIATVLHVPQATVRTHIQAILFKLDVRSAVTAVAFARRAGVASVREYQVVPR